MRNLLYLSLILLVITACSGNDFDPEKGIYGIWRMSESIDKHSREKSDDPLLDEAKKLEDVKEGHVLSIFPDNSFTELIGKGNYSFGTWKWLESGKVIQFSHSDKKKATYNVEFNALDTNNVQVNLSNSTKQFIFLKEAKLLKNFKEEPFYVENNLWRNKAIAHENKAQLMERLGNYFKHMLYLLKAADERQLEVISFEYSLGIIQIYNGGIGIHEMQVIPQEWKDTYYDQENLQEVYDLYRNYLEKDSYRGAGTSNWVKDDYTILLSIYNDLKSGKF